MDSLGLKEVIFENAEENIWTLWGLPLDHIFVRGLSWESARVLSDRKCSDHYPLYVEFFVLGDEKEEPLNSYPLSVEQPSPQIESKRVLYQ